MENIDKLKEIMKELENKEKRSLNEKETKEKIDKLLDGATCIICATDNGIYNFGTQSEIMNLLTTEAIHLKDDMPKELIKFAIENGLCDDFEEGLKHLLDSLTNREGE